VGLFFLIASADLCGARCANSSAASLYSKMTPCFGQRAGLLGHRAEAR